MPEDEVKEYQRLTKSGQKVVVRSHSRSNAGAAAQALARPGRPPIAARGGTFPNGRSIPNVFVPPPSDIEGSPPTQKPLSNPDEHGEFGKKIPDHLRAILEPEFDAKTGKPLKKDVPLSKRTNQVVQAASSILLGDASFVTLAGEGFDS